MVQFQFVPTQTQCFRLRCGCAALESACWVENVPMCGFFWGIGVKCACQSFAGLICHPVSSYTLESALPSTPLQGAQRLLHWDFL